MRPDVLIYPHADFLTGRVYARLVRRSPPGARATTVRGQMFTSHRSESTGGGWGTAHFVDGRSVWENRGCTLRVRMFRTTSAGDRRKRGDAPAVGAIRQRRRGAGIDLTSSLAACSQPIRFESDSGCQGCLYDRGLSVPRHLGHWCSHRGCYLGIPMADSSRLTVKRRLLASGLELEAGENYLCARAMCSRPESFLTVVFRRTMAASAFLVAGMRRVEPQSKQRGLLARKSSAD